MGERLLGTHSDRKIRVNPSLTPDTHDKLKMLALACGQITKTKLAERIIEIALNDAESVRNIQQRLAPKDNPYKVRAITINGQVFYKNGFEQK
jgi:hypothetical protein